MRTANPERQLEESRLTKLRQIWQFLATLSREIGPGEWSVNPLEAELGVRYTLEAPQRDPLPSTNAVQGYLAHMKPPPPP